MKTISVLILLLLTSLCGVAQDKQLYILQTSDTHSRIEPLDTRFGSSADKGGYVRRAAFVHEARKQHPDLLLFDCGDISQGTPYYNMFKGEVEIKLMNLMKYDAMVLGNHEFDYGMDNMARLFTLANFPVLCANYNVTGTVLDGLVKPYIVLVRDGVRIGVFGLSPRLEGLVQSDKCVGVVYHDPLEVAQQIVNRLRTQEACDVVICLSHLGFNTETPDGHYDENLVNMTHGIDLILGGHTHTEMVKPAKHLNAVGKSVSVMHVGKNGIDVGELILTLTEK